MARDRHGLVVCLWLAALMDAPGLAAQGLSATLAVSKSLYFGGDYTATLGDWQADATLRYHVDGPFRVGVGIGGGKLDEPTTDSSFSSFKLFLEPSLAWDVGADLNAWAGARYGWAHERVLDRANGLWAWGWEGGAVGGLDYAVSEDVGLGLQAEAMRLDLRRDDSGLAPAGGLDREGWRLSLGPVVRFGGGL